MVKSVSAVDAIYGSTKNATKKVTNAIKEHQDQIISSGVLLGGTALYVSALKRYADGDEAVVSPEQAQALEEKKSFIKKLGEKVKEKFSIDLNNPPDGIDPTQPYMMDKFGNYVMDDYGVIPNPWYNPDAVAKGVDAVASTQFNPVSMESFLKHAASEGAETAEQIASIADIPFGGDDVDIDESTLEAIANGVKNIFEKITDFV